MSRFENLRQAARRAYAASRDSLRAARERAEASNGDPDELAGDRDAGGQWSPAGELPSGPAGSPPVAVPDSAAPPPAAGSAAPTPAAGSVAPALGADPTAPARDRTVREAPLPVEEAVPRSLQIAAAWSWRLIVIAAVGWGLLWIANRYLLLVAPLMIALLLTGLLMPAQRGLIRLRVHRSLAALLVMIAGIAAVGGTLYLVVVAFIAGLDEMSQRVEQGIIEIENWLRDGPLQMTDADLENLVSSGQDWLEGHTQELTTVGLSAVTGTVQFLTGLILVIVVTFFLLRDGGRIWRFLVGMLPVPARAPMDFAGAGAWQSLSGYIRATVLVALVDAIGIGLGLLILSWTMTYPRGLVLPVAALVFLGGFVPIVGAFVSGTVGVLVGLVTGETPAQGLIQAMIVLGIVLLVQQLEGNVLQPFIVSKMVRIHPLAVILAVMAGALLAGIIGALVAVPVTAVLNTVIRRLNHYHQRHRRPPAEVEVAPADR